MGLQILLSHFVTLLLLVLCAVVSDVRKDLVGILLQMLL